MDSNNKELNPFEGELFEAFESAYNYLVKIDKDLVTILQGKIQKSDPEYKVIMLKITMHRKRIKAFSEKRRKIMVKYKSV